MRACVRGNVRSGVLSEIAAIDLTQMATLLLRLLVSPPAHYDFILCGHASSKPMGGRGRRRQVRARLRAYMGVYNEES